MARADILIVGQGLAGTLLGWELERAGVSFALMDDGHASAASLVSAGIINPITGRRLVKSWRFETLFPRAREMYREMEAAFGVSVWREMRVRRIFTDAREREIGADPGKLRDLAPYLESADSEGWWVGQAARVDLTALLAAAQKHWVSAGKLRMEAADLKSEAEKHELVIDCRGFAGAKAAEFSFVHWEFSKGELLELEVDGLEADVILNSRQWIAPLQAGAALAGATHEPGVCDRNASTVGRAAIETAVRGLLGHGRACRVIGQRVGIRVHAPDKRPVVGLHPERPRIGLLNGLGGKGALWAPMLARQWASHIAARAPFDPETDVRRFQGETLT